MGLESLECHQRRQQREGKYVTKPPVLPLKTRIELVLVALALLRWTYMTLKYLLHTLALTVDAIISRRPRLEASGDFGCCGVIYRCHIILDDLEGAMYRARNVLFGVGRSIWRIAESQWRRVMQALEWIASQRHVIRRLSEQVQIMNDIVRRTDWYVLTCAISLC